MMNRHSWDYGPHGYARDNQECPCKRCGAVLTYRPRPLGSRYRSPYQSRYRSPDQEIRLPSGEILTNPRRMPPCVAKP